MKKTLLILAVFTFGATAFSQIPNYVPQNGLVGWWPFNGNANDESGNGNHGTVNGATLTADRFGNVNQAYGFDGVDDSISVISSANIQLTSSNILSIECWFYNFNSPVYGGALISKYQNGTPINSSIALVSYSNNLIQIGGNGTQPFPTIPYISNQWNQIVLLYNIPNPGNVKVYLNGSYLTTLNIPLNPSPNNSPLKFGATDCPVNDPNCNFYSGSLDDIGIWNRALTECEIQDLYHAQLNSASLSISAGSDQSICAGDNITLNGAGGSNYQWNNNVVDGQSFAPTQSNAYALTAQDSLGCIGTDTVVVTVLENSASTLTETALDSYTLNGQTYTQSGTYTQTLTAANGCDSTITLNLTLNFTGIDELGTNAKKLVNITDLNGKTIPRRKNTLMLFIFEDGTVERVVEMEE